MSLSLRWAVLLAAGLLTACAFPYKPDIQQGNVVTQEMVETLEPGMTQRQVRFVLGTPLVTDPFHRNRWDYYYFAKKGDTGEVTRQRLTVIFKDSVVVEVRHIPAEPDGGSQAKPASLYGQGPQPNRRL